MIKVIIVDDHPPLREGIKLALQQEKDIRVVGEANDGEEMFSVLSRNPCTDVLLLDVEMPNFRVYDAIPKLQTQYPNLGILIVTGYDDRSRILKLIDLGVAGYMLKEEPLKMYAYAIGQIAGGQSYFGQRVAHVALTANGHGAIVLTPREQEVLTFAATGLASPAIAVQLGISSKTVDTHIERACRKLGAPNRTTAVLRATELGLITVPAGEGGRNGE